MSSISTGRVMNVVDAVQPSQALAITAVAKALQQVNNVQCGPAGGECGGTPSIKDGPPPIGGDKPGFLATGDLPPAGPKVAPWVATEIELPTDEFKGSAVRERELGNHPSQVEGRKDLPDPGHWDELLRPGRDRADHQGRQGGQKAGGQDQVQPDELQEPPADRNRL